MSIVDRGAYRTGNGAEVPIAADVARAVAGTRLYLPDEALPTPEPQGRAAVEVTNESSLDAARRLHNAGSGPVACLNFASARNPGGGFRSGAQAQEESLARASALHACLQAAGDFYEYHRGHRELTYSDRVIYSPAVPVFRDDAGDLLDAPYPVTFLTAAAPNRAAIATQQPHHLDAIAAILRRRAARVLAVAAANGHHRLVLGAWGCGVFGNDPRIVATAFADALDRGRWFDEVVFAVLDHQPGRATYAAFAEVFRDRRAVTAEPSDDR